LRKRLACAAEIVVQVANLRRVANPPGRVRQHLAEFSGGNCEARTSNRQLGEPPADWTTATRAAAVIVLRALQLIRFRLFAARAHAG